MHLKILQIAQFSYYEGKVLHAFTENNADFYGMTFSPGCSIMTKTITMTILVNIKNTSLTSETRHIYWTFSWLNWTKYNTQWQRVVLLRKEKNLSSLPLIQFRGRKHIPAAIRCETGYILDRLPVCRRINRHSYSLSHLWCNLESPINLIQLNAYHWTVGESRREATRKQGELCTEMLGQLVDSVPGPSCCKATALTRKIWHC